MTDKILLKEIAPCSLCCYTCPAMIDGVVSKHAEILHHYFEGYYDFQRENLPTQWKSHAETFKAFDEKLVRYTNPSCKGCRDNSHGSCCIKDCFILDCTKEKQIDFCAECDEFPCDKLTMEIYNPTVIEEWRKGNKRIREVGLKQYYEEITSRSHYAPFKKGEV